MQGRSFGIAVAVTLFWSLPSPALQPLDVFVASARERNPDALEAKAGLSQQNAQSDVALGRVLPGISARGAYTRNQYGTTVDLGNGPITVVPDHQWDGSATVTVPLIDAAGWARAAARLQVEAQVAQNYDQLVADSALVAVSGTALEVSKEGLRLAQNRLSAGVAPALEVDRARADVEQQTQ